VRALRRRGSSREPATFVGVSAALPVLVGTALLLIASDEVSKNHSVTTLGLFKWGIGLVVFGAGLGVLAAVMYFWPSSSGGDLSNAKVALDKAPVQPAPVQPAPVRTPSSDEPTPVADGRIVVNRTPTELVGYFKGVTHVQGTDATGRYIGKWMRVSGTLQDVRLLTTGIAQVNFNEWTSGNGWVFCYFSDKNWIDRLVLMKPGDELTVLGKIDRISSSSVELEKCELEL
jgi:tRNA_anti-like